MPLLRPARDDDSEGVIALIASVFAEYPGVILDVDLEEPELRAPATNFPYFWVAEDEGGEVVGCIGCAEKDGGVELKKLYVHRSTRRTGLGRRLVALVEDHARGCGADRIFLWSDTRFETAHVFYRDLDYTPTGRTRELHDISDTSEYEFVKTRAQFDLS